MIQNTDTTVDNSDGNNGARDNNYDCVVRIILGMIGGRELHLPMMMKTRPYMLVRKKVDRALSSNAMMVNQFASRSSSS
eukprot:scaffold4278_cov173-Amphora_coffeaeformis.AAC.14